MPTTDPNKAAVLAEYPNAQCIWTSRGWRVIAHQEGGGPVFELGRTQSGHVLEEEAWKNAANNFPMTIDKLRNWMKLINTPTLELILLQGDPDKPKWFTDEMTAEVQRRRAAQSLKESR